MRKAVAVPFQPFRVPPVSFLPSISWMETSIAPNTNNQKCYTQVTSTQYFNAPFKKKKYIKEVVENVWKTRRSAQHV